MVIHVMRWATQLHLRITHCSSQLLSWAAPPGSFFTRRPRINTNKPTFLPETIPKKVWIKVNKASRPRRLRRRQSFIKISCVPICVPFRLSGSVFEETWRSTAGSEPALVSDHNCCWDFVFESVILRVRIRFLLIEYFLRLFHYSSIERALSFYALNGDKNSQE